MNLVGKTAIVTGGGLTQGLDCVNRQVASIQYCPRKFLKRLPPAVPRGPNKNRLASSALATA